MESLHWQRNLYVCLFGSFTTVLSMTLLLPFLPVFVAHLGVADEAGVVRWSGLAFSATFLAAGVVAPIWGRFADRYGRRLVLVRASLGMAVVMSAMGLSQNVYQLVGLRLLAGLLGGYASGATVLVATQTPKARSGWALGMLSTGIMAGSLIGPLVGGILPGLIGIRNTFFLSGAVIFVAFLATVFLIREELDGAARRASRFQGSAWSTIVDRRPVLTMLVTGALLLLASMSIEPIITVFIGQIVVDQRHVVLTSGVVMAVTALGSILAAPRVGKLADRVGHWPVVIGCLMLSGLILIPQAFVTASWQLIALRFLMGIALGGLMPCVTALIRHSVPDHVSGTILGYSTSAQYAGQVTGPLLGGLVGAHFGVRVVMLATALVMFLGAALNWIVLRATRAVDSSS